VLTPRAAKRLGRLQRSNDGSGETTLRARRRSRASAFSLGLSFHSGWSLRSSMSRSTEFVTLRAAPVMKCFDIVHSSPSPAITLASDDRLPRARIVDLRTPGHAFRLLHHPRRASSSSSISTRRAGRFLTITSSAGSRVVSPHIEPPRAREDPQNRVASSMPASLQHGSNHAPADSRIPISPDHSML